MTGERRSRPLPRLTAAGEFMVVVVDDEVMMLFRWLRDAAP
jgi:hypothetical protein